MIKTNCKRIKELADHIYEMELALDWLEKYGDKIESRGNAAHVHVTFKYAESCSGAAAAERVVTVWARTMLTDAIATAIVDCRNTIAIEKNTIAVEVSWQREEGMKSA